MLVLDTKPKDIIQIECCGSYDSDSPYYLITSYQDLENKVRAYKSLGGGIIHLHPDNKCRVVTADDFFDVPQGTLTRSAK